MASYFRQVPDFDYISRDVNDRYISKYTLVKNLFKRGKIRDDIFENITFFDKYTIIGDERPDNVAAKIYDNSTLDWVVLLSNNILDVQSEWPLTQKNFDKFMLEKYENYDNLYSGIHHYETYEIRTSDNILMLKSGIKMSPTWETNGNFIRNGSSYYYEFYDSAINTVVQIPSNNFLKAVTNFEYEYQLDDEKRNIYLLKPDYLNIVFDDMKKIMTYKKGSTQYLSDTLKRGDDIRLLY